MPLLTVDGERAVLMSHKVCIMTVLSIVMVAKIVTDANGIREASYVPGEGPAYGQYLKTWDGSVYEAIANAGIWVDVDLRQLIWFLAISGEGREICERVARFSDPRVRIAHVPHQDQ